MNRKDSVLIVDDDVLSRTPIHDLLSDEYEIIDAANGIEALAVLEKCSERIAAIVLDWLMPIMGGEEFMTIVHDNVRYNSIPILVATSLEGVECEHKALELGAWDFITKPYNYEIIKFRIKNVIEKNKLLFAELDLVTGIYVKERFFQVLRDTLRRNSDEKYTFIRFDIDRFKMINNFYGIKEGDRILKIIAIQLKTAAEIIPSFCYGKMENDIFVCCLKRNQADINFLLDMIKRKMKSETKDYHLKLSFGIYEIENNLMDVSEIYDRATLAAKNCKEKYDKDIVYYTPSMIESMKLEQGILNDVNKAIEEEQFKVYLQPKYDLRTNKHFGAEALVRWIHPEKGMISPGTFIPLFENNGFIGKLDFYMWTKVCELIRKWLDEGREINPISVNVSRVNLYNPHLAEIFHKLIQNYDIPPELLNLELTESAFMQDQDVVMKTMSNLRSMGFKIMMDDFGSGYSSLNVLKDIELDYLKIDMKFLQKRNEDGKGEKILTSIIRMAKWLQLPSIVEGVETQQQVEFLKSIGCEYVQGFYFAKPMPVNNYEKLMDEEEKADVKAVSYKFNSVFEDMWKTNSMVNQLFETINIPLALYEYKNDRIEMIRANSVFNELVGVDKIDIDANADNILIDYKEFEFLHEGFERLVNGEKVERFKYSVDDKNVFEITLQLIDKFDDTYMIIAVYYNLNT